MIPHPHFYIYVIRAAPVLVVFTLRTDFIGDDMNICNGTKYSDFMSALFCEISQRIVVITDVSGEHVDPIFLTHEDGIGRFFPKRR
jgi:hypothetical protein